MAGANSPIPKEMLRDRGFRFCRFWFFIAIYHTAKRFERPDGTVDFTNPEVRNEIHNAGAKVTHAATMRGFMIPPEEK